MTCRCDPFGSDAVTFFIPGLPLPKGSGVSAKGPNGKMKWFETADRATKTRQAGALTSWQKAVGQVARMVWRTKPIDGPVVARLIFWLPKSLSSADKRGSGDLDKLERAVYDALESVVYVNDARVVEHHVEKRIGEPTGVTVTIGRRKD